MMQGADEISRILIKTYSKKAEFGYLFGSVLTERFNEESDIDFGIFFKKKPSRKDLLKLHGEASELFYPRKSDLIILNHADPIIINQILRHGKLFLNNNSSLLHCFIAQKLSEYFDFKRSREVVEQNLLRGKLHD